MRDKPRFGVPVCRRRVAVHRAEISLPVHQRVAQRERLRHADQRIVNRRVAVRVILAEHVSDDAGALLGGPVEVQAHLAHGVKNAAMDRLQAVADVRQRSTDDDAHRVVEIRPAHLVFDVDGNEVLIAVAVVGQLGPPATRRDGRVSDVVVLCQKLLLKLSRDVAIPILPNPAAVQRG